MTMYAITPGFNRPAIAFAVSLALAAGAASISGAAHAQQQSIMITPDQIKWNPSATTQGSTNSVIHGHPAKPGVVVTRVRYPANTRILPHSHSADSYVVILSGTVMYGEGEKFDETKMKAYPAGSFIMEAARVPHFWYAKEPVEFQAISNGPSSYDFVDATMDPRKKK